MKVPIIYGHKIVLKSVKISEADTLLNFYNNADMFRANPDEKLNLEEKERYITFLNDLNEAYYAGIHLQSTDQLIGTVLVGRINKSDKTAYTETLISEDYTNQGYGTDAKHALLKFIFEELHLRKVYAEVYAYNKIAQAYVRECGYRYIATFPKKKFFQGDYWDELIFEITKKDWLPVWEAYKKKHE